MDSLNVRRADFTSEKTGVNVNKIEGYLAEALEEVLLSALDATVEVTALAATEELDEVLRFHVEELVQIDTTEGVLLEGTLLLDLDFRHGDSFVSEFLKKDGRLETFQNGGLEFRTIGVRDKELNEQMTGCYLRQKVYFEAYIKFKLN